MRYPAAMDGGELVVRWSVWLAVVCLPVAAFGPALPEGRTDRLGRAVSTAGCLAFVVHVAAAFHVRYGWSHAVAVAETARQAAERTGVAAGAGIWLNYLFALLWCVDVALWWHDPAARRRRPFARHAWLFGFLLFILFNGAVVFVDGPLRWLGLAATLAGVAGLVAAFRAGRGRARSDA